MDRLREMPVSPWRLCQGYRTKPWRIFQLSGFGKPEDENERIKFLLRTGETGFLMEHDRNTADHLYNVDHPEVVARREDVGLTGAPMQSIRDTHLCLEGIPIETTYGHAGGAVANMDPMRSPPIGASPSAAGSTSRRSPARARAISS